MQKTIWLLCFLLIGSLSFSQEMTNMRFYIKGSTNYYIKIDNELLPLQNTHSLKPGNHKIQIWSPMHKMYTGEIEVPKKEEATYYKELEKDEEYVKYLFAMDDYKRKLFWGRTAPIFAAGIGAVSTPILFILTKNAHEEYIIQDFKSRYFNDGESNAAFNRYAALSTLTLTGAALAVGGITTHLLLRKRMKALERPTYKQQNPFTLEMFEISLNPINRAPQAGVTLSF